MTWATWKYTCFRNGMNFFMLSQDCNFLLVKMTHLVVLVAQSCLTVIPWIVARQAPLSIDTGKNTGMCSHSLLQEIFLTQGMSPGLPHCRQINYPLSHQGSFTHLVGPFI